MSGASAKKIGEAEETWVHAHRGLCSTCALASECTFPRHPQIPVMHCDEFRGYEREPAAAEHARSRSVPADREEELLEGEHVGLCRNCRHRNDCTFPKPARGVLFCDEYE